MTPGNSKKNTQQQPFTASSPDLTWYLESVMPIYGKEQATLHWDIKVFPNT